MDSITMKVIEILKDNSDLDTFPEDVDINDDISKIGINSIAYIKIIVAIEAEFGFEFPHEDIDFSKFRTINDLVQYINEKIAED